jgi:hypothetical protein
MKPIVIALITSLATASAAAQAVYRCGSTYSQVACAQGHAVAIDDSRTPAQQAEARQVAADERRLAAEMRRDRLADEREARPSGAANLGGAATVRHVAPLSAPTHKKKQKKRLADAPFQPMEVLVVEPRQRRNGA